MHQICTVPSVTTFGTVGEKWIGLMIQSFFLLNLSHFYTVLRHSLEKMKLCFIVWIQHKGRNLSIFIILTNFSSLTFLFFFVSTVWLLFHLMVVSYLMVLTSFSNYSIAFICFFVFLTLVFCKRHVLYTKCVPSVTFTRSQVLGGFNFTFIDLIT